MRHELFNLTHNEQIIEYYRCNPVQAAKDICNIDLIWFQRIILRDLWYKSYCILNLGRGASKCQPFGSLVYDYDKFSFVPIESLVDKKFNTLSLDKKYKLVKSVAKAEYNGLEECVKVILRSGREIEVTLDHPFMKIEGWVSARNLVVGDRVAVARKLPEGFEAANIARARLLGYFIGDGGITNSVSFTNMNENVLNDFKSLIIEEFGNCKFVYIDAGKATTIRVTNKWHNPVIPWLKEMNIYKKKSINKTVPDVVYGWNNKSLAHFIGAYFDCDGWVSQSTGEIGFGSSSKELLVSLQRLLLRFGILSKLSYHMAKCNGKEFDSWKLDIRDNDSRKLFYDNIVSISGKRDKLVKFFGKTPNPNLDTVPQEIWERYKKIPGVKLRRNGYKRIYGKKYSPSRNKLLLCGIDIGVEDAVNLATSDIFWDEIVEKKYTGIKNTYSVEVPEFHNYLSDTIITHNSTMFAIYATLLAVLYSGRKIGIFAPSFNQQKIVFNEMERLWDNSPYLQMVQPRGISKGAGLWRIDYGKSFIEAVPLGHDGARARGRRYTNVLADEFAFIDGELIDLVIRPMLNIKYGGRSNQFVIASTAFYKWNHYWGWYCHYYKMMQEDPANYSVLEFDYRDVAMTINSPFEVDLKNIEDTRRKVPWERFAMENLAIFPDESVGYFSAKLIDACTPKREGRNVDYEPLNGDRESVYFMGIDCARTEGGDNFAVALVKRSRGNQKKLVRLETLNGRPYKEMIYLIRTMLRDYNVARIANDNAGGGQTIRDMLGEPWEDWSTGKRVVHAPIVDMDVPEKEANGIQILRQVKFTLDKKAELYTNFKAELEKRNFLFPIDIRKDEDIDITRIGNEIAMAKSELMVIGVEATSTGYRFTTPSSMRDDRATAIILANAASLEVRREEREEEVYGGDMATGLWVPSDVYNPTITI